MTGHQYGGTYFLLKTFFLHLEAIFHMKWVPHQHLKPTEREIPEQLKCV
jgi:hypothetical protein